MNAWRTDPPVEEDVRLAAALRTALADASVADALAAPLPSVRHLDLIVRTAARAITAGGGILFLVDRQSGVLTSEVIVGSAESTPRLTLPLDRGLIGLVALSGQPMALGDARNDPHHAQDLAAQIGHLPRSVLAVPIVATSGEPILGVLELFDRAGDASFSLDDIGLLGLFAQQTAFAVEQRQVRSSGVDLIGRALAAAGLPTGAFDRLIARAEQLGTAGEDTPSRRRHALAESIARISRGGDAEYRLAEAVLSALAGYVHDRPPPPHDADVFS